MDQRRRVLAKILFDDRAARQFDPRAVEDTETIVNSLLPVTRSIPTEYLYECYVVAMEMRPAGNNFPISGIELVQAWKEKQGSLEMESLRSDRLLAERAPGACLRCDKLGREIMADGSIGGPCDHRPFSEEEMAAATQKRVDFVAEMRAQARRADEARRKAAEEAKAQAEVEKPKGAQLHCSSCQRKVTTLAGWTVGEPCGAKLDRESEICRKCGTATGVLSLGKMICNECLTSYEVVTCQGQMAA